MVVFLIVLVVLGVLLELISLRDSLDHVEFDCKPETDRTEPGTELALTVTVANTGILPISYIRAAIDCPLELQLPEGVRYDDQQFSKSVDSVFRLWGRQRVKRELTVSVRKRGVHVFHGATLNRGDFLGLRTTQRQYEFRHELLIYPRRMENSALRDALGSYCGDRIAQRHLIQDPILTMGVREYTGREAMKTISWSQSARRGSLMVRQFDYTRDLSCMVMLCANGIHPLDTETMDHCCAIARTVCEELTERGVNVDLYTNAALWGFAGRDVWSCSASAVHQGDMLETLARVYGSAQCSPMALADVCARAAGSDTAFVVIAPHDSDAVRSALRILHDNTGADALLLTADAFQE